MSTKKYSGKCSWDILSRCLCREVVMPVRKVKGGYRWGTSGKVYPTKEQAEKQGKAIMASGYKKKTKKK